jgi:hypothetical protein
VHLARGIGVKADPVAAGGNHILDLIADVGKIGDEER